jgi:hypothetical protein
LSGTLWISFHCRQLLHFLVAYFVIYQRPRCWRGGSCGVGDIAIGGGGHGLTMCCAMVVSTAHLHLPPVCGPSKAPHFKLPTTLLGEVFCTNSSLCRKFHVDILYLGNTYYSNLKLCGLWVVGFADSVPHSRFSRTFEWNCLEAKYHHSSFIILLLH